MKEKYQKALDIFTEKWKKNSDVIGIIATGSVVHSTPDKNSDIDVHIILNKAKTRERANTWINGVEVEYFINPVKQIESYFKTETQAHTAHMFVNGIVVYKKGKTMDLLLKKAKQILAKPLKPMTKVQRELAKYAIDDSKKDLEDVYLRKDEFAFERATETALDTCLEIFFKIKRSRTEKNKRLAPHLQKIDPAFAELFTTATLLHGAPKYQAVNNVASYTEKLLGGPRAKEWKLKGPLDLKNF